MGKDFIAGKAAPYAILLAGALAFSATAASQTGDVGNGPGFVPPPQPAPHGMGDYPVPPPGWGQQDMAGPQSPEAMPGPGPMGGFMGYGQQPGGYPPARPNAEYGASAGGSPFDAPDSGMPPRPGPVPEPGMDDARKRMGAASSMPPAPLPMFGMDASQGAFSGSMGGMSPPPMGPGMFPGAGGCSSGSGGASCAGKHFMGQGMGYGGMGHHGRMGHGRMEQGRMGQGTGSGGMAGAKKISRMLQLPGLSREQREKILDVMDELRRVHWGLLGKSMEHSAELRRLYGAEKQDARSIGAVYGKIFDIRRQMIETTIEANQKASDVLTEEQRKQFRSWVGSGY